MENWPPPCKNSGYAPSVFHLLHQTKNNENQSVALTVCIDQFYPGHRSLAGCQSLALAVSLNR